MVLNELAKLTSDLKYTIFDCQCLSGAMDFGRHPTMSGTFECLSPTHSYYASTVLRARTTIPQVHHRHLMDFTAPAHRRVRPVYGGEIFNELKLVIPLSLPHRQSVI